MPGFSFTAPIITFEEEERERAALGKDGLLALEEDLFGPRDDHDGDYYKLHHYHDDGDPDGEGGEEGAMENDIIQVGQVQQQQQQQQQDPTATSTSIRVPTAEMVNANARQFSSGQATTASSTQEQQPTNNEVVDPTISDPPPTTTSESSSGGGLFAAIQTKTAASTSTTTVDSQPPNKERKQQESTRIPPPTSSTTQNTTSDAPINNKDETDDGKSKEGRGGGLFAPITSTATKQTSAGGGLFAPLSMVNSKTGVGTTAAATDQATSTISNNVGEGGGLFAPLNNTQSSDTTTTKTSSTETSGQKATTDSHGGGGLFALINNKPTTTKDSTSDNKHSTPTPNSGGGGLFAPINDSSSESKKETTERTAASDGGLFALINNTKESNADKHSTMATVGGLFAPLSEKKETNEQESSTAVNSGGLFAPLQNVSKGNSSSDSGSGGGLFSTLQNKNTDTKQSNKETGGGSGGGLFAPLTNNNEGKPEKCSSATTASVGTESGPTTDFGSGGLFAPLNNNNSGPDLPKNEAATGGLFAPLNEAKKATSGSGVPVTASEGGSASGGGGLFAPLTTHSNISNADPTGNNGGGLFDSVSPAKPASTSETQVKPTEKEETTQSSAGGGLFSAITPNSTTSKINNEPPNTTVTDSLRGGDSLATPSPVVEATKADKGARPAPVAITDDPLTAGNHLHSFIMEELSKLDKRDYLEALQKAPVLVHLESNPLKMLQCEKFNLKAAGVRLAKYWKWRKKLFGADRAFLPMTQSGAMYKDLDALSKGFVSILPHDGKGRLVVFFDRIRAVPPTASRETVARILFYVLQKALDEDSARRTGFVFIKNLIGYDLYTHFDRILDKAVMAMLGDCFPSKLKAFHICAGSGKWVVELILPVMKQIAGKYIRLHMVCHTGSNAELIQELRRYHLIPEHLSVTLGGEIHYDHYIQWITEERLLEEGEFDPSDEEDFDNEMNKDEGTRSVDANHHHSHHHHHHPELHDGSQPHHNHQLHHHDPHLHLQQHRLSLNDRPFGNVVRQFSGTLP